MWESTQKIVTREITAKQMWKLYKNIEGFPIWDNGIEWTKLHGEFNVGSHYTLKPKWWPKADIEIINLVEDKEFDDVTHFFGAKMYGYHRLRETNDGLEISVTMKVQGWMSWFWVRIVASDIIKELPETFKRQIEYAKSL